MPATSRAYFGAELGHERSGLGRRDDKAKRVVAVPLDGDHVVGVVGRTHIGHQLARATPRAAKRPCFSSACQYNPSDGVLVIQGATMSDGYFGRLVEATSSRVWVNNPTLEEVTLALEQGAAGCTTNPAYGGNLLRRAPAQIRPLIAAAVRETGDDELAAEVVQRRLVARILERFRPVFDASDGRLGFVSLQGPPEADTETAPILAAAERARLLAPNCVPKIPATAPGLEALSALVADGEPTIVTEVFSLAQVAAAAERYLDITARTKLRPPFIMSPITGIFGDHLRSVAERIGIPVERAATDWAGVAFARAAAALVARRGYPVMLLFGGARTTVDLTGLVGGGHCATINWSTFAEVLERDPECRESLHDETDPKVTATLAERFDDFRRALDVDALTVAEFEGFGPVQHFRNSFIAGWQAVLGEVRAERAGVPAHDEAQVSVS